MSTEEWMEEPDTIQEAEGQLALFGEGEEIATVQSVGFSSSLVLNGEGNQ